MTQKLPHAVMVTVQGDTAGGVDSMPVLVRQLAFGLVFVAMCQVMVESVHPAAAYRRSISLAWAFVPPRRGHRQSKTHATVTDIEESRFLGSYK